MGVSILAQLTDTAIPLCLTISQDGVGGVTGKSPTVSVRDGATTDSYLDWDDGTFKAAGWGTKYAALTEVERGHYSRALDASAIVGLAFWSVLIAEYHVDDGAGIVGDDHDVITIADSRAIGAAL